jgi:hypothetical protein
MPATNVPTSRISTRPRRTPASTMATPIVSPAPPSRSRRAGADWRSSATAQGDEHQHRHRDRADEGRGQAGGGAHQRGHQRQIESTERPGPDIDWHSLGERPARLRRDAETRAQRGPGAGFSGRRLRHPGQGEDLQTGDGQQDEVDSLRRVGRESDEGARAERTDGQSAEGREAVIERPTRAVGIEDRRA